MDHELKEALDAGQNERATGGEGYVDILTEEEARLVLAHRNQDHTKPTSRLGLYRAAVKRYTGPGRGLFEHVGAILADLEAAPVEISHDEGLNAQVVITAEQMNKAVESLGVGLQWPVSRFRLRQLVSGMFQYLGFRVLDWQPSQDPTPRAAHYARR
jgi:hypothetical protein